MSDWEILDTGSRSAEENMRFDALLLDELASKSRPILHFYEWASDSATYGYFTDPARFLDLSASQALGLSLARRPTGGGIIFHAWDFAFSVLIPASCSLFSTNTLANYAFINDLARRACQEFLATDHSTLIPEDFTPQDAACSSFCMARPTKYDVVIDGRKVIGAAERRTRHGLLHQGSIALLLPPEEYLDRLLLPNLKVREAMLLHTYPLLGKKGDSRAMMDARRILKQNLEHLVNG